MLISHWKLDSSTDSSGNSNFLSNFSILPQNIRLSQDGLHSCISNITTVDWNIPASTFNSHFSFEFHFNGFVDNGILFSTPVIKVWQRLIGGNKLLVIEGTGFEFGVVIKNDGWNHFRASLPLSLNPDEVSASLNGRSGISFNWPPTTVTNLVLNSSTISFGVTGTYLSDLKLYDSEINVNEIEEYSYLSDKQLSYKFQETLAFNPLTKKIIEKSSQSQLKYSDNLDGISEYYQFENNNSKYILFSFEFDELQTFPINGIIAREGHFNVNFNVNSELTITLENYTSTSVQTISGNHLKNGLNFLEVITSKNNTQFLINGNISVFSHVDSTAPLKNGDVLLGVDIDIFNSNLKSNYSTISPISLEFSDTKFTTNYPIKVIPNYGNISEIGLTYQQIDLLNSEQSKNFDYSSDISIFFEFSLKDFTGTKELLFISDANNLGIRIQYTSPNLILSFGSGTITHSIGVANSKINKISILKNDDKLILFLNFDNVGEIISVNYPATLNIPTQIQISKNNTPNNSIIIKNIVLFKFIISPFYYLYKSEIGKYAIENFPNIVFDSVSNSIIDSNFNVQLESSNNWTIGFKYNLGNSQNIHENIELFEFKNSTNSDILKFTRIWDNDRIIMSKNGVNTTITFDTNNVFLQIVRLTSGEFQIFNNGIKVFEIFSYINTESYDEILINTQGIFEKFIVFDNEIHSNSNIISNNIDSEFQPTTTKRLADWEFDFDGNSTGINTIAIVPSKSDVNEKQFDFVKTESTDGYLFEFILSPTNILRGITFPRLDKTYKIHASNSNLSCSAIETIHNFSKTFSVVSAEINEITSKIKFFIDGQFITESDIFGTFSIDNSDNQSEGIFISSDILKVRISKASKLLSVTSENSNSSTFDFPITKYYMNTDINGKRILNDNLLVDCEKLFIADLIFANQSDNIKLSHGVLSFTQVGDVTNLPLSSNFYGEITQESTTLSGNISGTIYKNIKNI